MKKGFVISLFVSILLGFMVGNILYNEYKREGEKIGYNSYLLQEGIYSSKEELNAATSKFKNYTAVEQDGKYYVYLGITTNKKNAEKVRSILKENDINVTIKKTVINNIEFISNLEQFDILLNTAKSESDVLSINDVILSSYEEMVLETN